MTGLFAVVQAIFLLLLTPLFTGISRQIRAKMHSRQGPGIMQDYRDIIKLLKRQSVAPRDSGFIFRVMPYVLLGSMLLLAMALPVVTTTSLFSGAGDLIIILYIFALFRFFFSLSGLDTGSPFAGIGASRELTLGVLVEPILFLGLLVVALIAGSTNIGSISAVMSQGWVSPTATLLAMLACGFATFIEMGKIPFDVAEAEQELQEGPLTEYSGSGLALVKWGIGLKQVVVAVLFLSIFFPFGSASVLTAGSLLLALVLMLVKLLVIFVLASLVENSLARGRFLLTHHVTWLGFGVAALGFVFYLTGL
ncbi:TPA: respiratory chain complex I subunit 1 family protein [Morganella morganii subsp. sibonii]|nr:respiratory chain complex I subunit 1 family protein [Morganella morganii]MBS9542338.1 respiratory chain complex I subunit 1 family protein [Morganella morganii subsp. morganii]HDU8308252.1 respiratory chain complex I subunit 1 family protein [Morganella morganii subsp. sibonii]EKK5571486.1 respiratory chain complex I subunit 1 family protein [Morganella morganii]EKU5841725.1 respiratory chain complex I subunit 1 family protein [Morganella morganii]